MSLLVCRRERHGPPKGTCRMGISSFERGRQGPSGPVVDRGGPSFWAPQSVMHN
jgi:hypothetical protein